MVSKPSQQSLHAPATLTPPHHTLCSPGTTTAAWTPTVLLNWEGTFTRRDTGVLSYPWNQLRLVHDKDLSLNVNNVVSENVFIRIAWMGKPQQGRHCLLSFLNTLTAAPNPTPPDIHTWKPTVDCSSSLCTTTHHLVQSSSRFWGKVVYCDNRKSPKLPSRLPVELGEHSREFRDDSK